ncbi:MAG: tRNA 2-thiouridine(34) synthase MnmA [bacterium]|nr:tRNA 2-thiouridine(34) synthase MnmA [bacterium]
MEKGKKVFVGMSGGVDSSVTAALLKKEGYDVTGVFIKVWSPDWLPCTWKDERRDAMRVAAHLDIPFFTFDFENEYKKAVADYMIDEYKKGRTPNPDVMCNKEIKFGSFLKKALEMGADYIATGHYVQNIDTTLIEGVDTNKDQSYFLWTIPTEDLTSVLFPIGSFQKSEVRALATKFNLPTASKKDSQGLCFIGKVEMKEFLKHYIESNPGNVVNEKGEIIGIHEGAVFYTIGQRHGYSLTKKSATDTPYYIVKKDIDANTLTVSQKLEEDSLKTIKRIILSEVNIRGESIDVTKKYGARIRYRQGKQFCTITKDENNNFEIEFDIPQQGVSLGQSVVIYSGLVCLGGGIIKKVR